MLGKKENSKRFISENLPIHKQSKKIDLNINIVPTSDLNNIHKSIDIKGYYVV